MRHSGSVFAACFSPGDSLVLTGSQDGTAQLWSATDGTPIGKPLKHAYWVTAVAFRPDGKAFATGSGKQFGREDSDGRRSYGVRRLLSEAIRKGSKPGSR